MATPSSLPSAVPQLWPVESVQAAEAFARYLEMGPERSLRKLAIQDVASGRYRSFQSARRLYHRWSSRYRWQERLHLAVNERLRLALDEVAELDAHTYLVTSRKLREMVDAENHAPSTLIAIRGAVKPPVSKSSATVNLTVDVQIRQLAERIAAEEGVDVETLLAETDDFVRSLNS